MIISRSVDINRMVHMYSGILCSNKHKGNYEILRKIDGSGKKIIVEEVTQSRKTNTVCSIPYADPSSNYMTCSSERV